MIIHFYKMHALGNDFIIIDNTNDKITLTIPEITLLCNRRFGIGCDQLILTKEVKPLELIKMTIFNSDGTSATACGNATRCVGLYFMNKYQTNKISIKTDNRTIPVHRTSEGLIVANMGKALFKAEDIPLADGQLNPAALDFSALGLSPKGMAVNVGNPHVVFVVKSLADIDLPHIGPLIENYKYFPNKTNVEFIEIIDKNTIKMRVWERGAGITLSCGTGATASFAAAYKQGLIGSGKTTIALDGGEIGIYHNSDGNIILEGAASVVFEGKIEI